MVGFFFFFIVALSELMAKKRDAKQIIKIINLNKMKKLKYGVLFLAIVGIGFTSCEKEEINHPESTKNSQFEETLESRIVIGFYFTWDEWGRKDEDCQGKGLCNFRLETIEIEIGHCTPVLTHGANGNMYIEILADEDLVSQNSNSNFYIDEDIYDQFNNETYKVPAGVYQINPNLGNVGGYVIPLIKL